MLGSRNSKADSRQRKSSDQGLKQLRRMDLLELLLDQMDENETQADQIRDLTSLSERLKAKLDEKDAQIEHLKDRLNQKDAQIKYMQQHGVPALGGSVVQPAVMSAVQAARAIPGATQQVEGAPSLTASYVVSATYPAMGAVGGQVGAPYAQQAAAPAVNARPAQAAVTGAVPGQRVLASPDSQQAQQQQQLVRQQLAQQQAAQKRAAQQMAQQQQAAQQRSGQPQAAASAAAATASGQRAANPVQQAAQKPAAQQAQQQSSWQQVARQSQAQVAPDRPVAQPAGNQPGQPAQQVQQERQVQQPAQRMQQAQPAQPAQRMQQAQPAAVLNEFAPPAFPDSITQLMASINASAAQPTANGGGA